MSDENPTWTALPGMLGNAPETKPTADPLPDPSQVATGPAPLKQRKPLVPVVKHGDCAQCSRTFTWAALGGRGAPREYCSTDCSDLAYAISRVQLYLTEGRVQWPATAEGIKAAQQTRGDLMALANVISSQLPKLPKKAKAQMKLTDAGMAPARTKKDTAVRRKRTVPKG